jgi:hypothetical protein
LAGLFNVLELNESLSFHVEKCYAGALIKRSLVIIKVLIYLISPACRIFTVELREIEPQWPMLEQSVPGQRIMVVILKVGTTIILIVPARIVKKSAITVLVAGVLTAIISVMSQKMAAIMFLVTVIVTAMNNRKLVRGCFG